MQNQSEIIATLQRERDEAKGILSQLNADYEKQSPMSRPPLAAQVDYIASVVSERDALRAQLAEREEDRALLDWLDTHHTQRAATLSGFASANQLSYRAAIRAARAQPEDGK